MGDQRDRRDQLKHTLSRHPSQAGLRSFHIHDPVYPGFLGKDFVPRTFRDGLRVIRASPVPGASHVISGDGLHEAAGLYVADLNESAVEEEDVGWMPGNPLCSAFPLDRTSMGRVCVFVDIQPKLCENYEHVPLGGDIPRTYRHNRAGTLLRST